MSTPSGMLIDRRDLDEFARRLCDRQTRFVGWGTGSVFDYFHQLHPLALDYLVDSDSARWGHTRHGIEVVSPEVLAREDPATTFVVIYSGYWPQIRAQIAALAPVPSLPASAAFAGAHLRARLGQAERVASEARPRTSRRDADAIIVQGPVIPEVTERVLRCFAALYPTDLVVLSTWNDTRCDLLEPLMPFVDELVLARKPDVPGIQNRNYQILSTRAGLERAIGCGARTILKTRTDLVVLEPDLFDRARWWCARVGPHPAHAAGLRERIIVPSTFTRKYLLYHPSDLVMLGAAEDLERYWSVPLDQRNGVLLSDARLECPIAEVNLEGNPAESYFGVEFCRSLRRPVIGTLADSWRFYRDLFSVVEDDWMGMLWFKNLSAPDAALAQGVRQTVSGAFWERLQRDHENLDRYPGELDPAAVPFRALTGVAA